MCRRRDCLKLFFKSTGCLNCIANLINKNMPILYSWKSKLHKIMCIWFYLHKSVVTTTIFVNSYHTLALNIKCVINVQLNITMNVTHFPFFSFGKNTYMISVVGKSKLHVLYNCNHICIHTICYYCLTKYHTICYFSLLHFSKD